MRRTCLPLLFVASLAIAGCDKSAEVAAMKQAMAAQVRAQERAEAQKAAVSPELRADDVAVEDVQVTLDGAAGANQTLTIQGVLRNAGDTPVAGVNLVVSLRDAQGLTVGGHGTQHYFAPPVPAGADQPLVLRIEGVVGSIAIAQSAEIEVRNLIGSQTSSPDGWEPLDLDDASARTTTVPGKVTRIAADGTVMPQGSGTAVGGQ